MVFKTRLDDGCYFEEMRGGEEVLLVEVDDYAAGIETAREVEEFEGRGHGLVWRGKAVNQE